MSEFKNKTALVTGATGGIGRAAALAFAKEGAKVVVSDIQDCDETLKQIKDAGGEATYIKCDVSQTEEVKNLIKKTVEEYGSLDYAFNNAGIEGDRATTLECTEDNFDRTISVNLRSIFLCMKYEIPEMLKSGNGAIVNCSSVAGLIGYPSLPAYVASKHGIIGLTKTTALEMAQQGIRINAVCPGGVETEMIERLAGGDKEAIKQFHEMHPIGRMGKPKEIADLVIWLCSGKSSFVTGQAIAADGGYVAQ